MLEREWKGAVALALAGLGIGLAFQHPTFDDPWITYRVAENLLAGRGFVYNSGERVLVTTTPLYTLLLVALGWLTGDVPGASLAISVLSAALGAAVLYLIGCRASRLAGVTSGLLYLLFPFLSTTFGMETAFLLFLALGGIYAYLQGRLVIAVVLLALATLTRMDAALLAGVLALHCAWAKRKAPLVLLLAYLAILAPWFAFSFLYFGQPFPSTLAAKVAQYQLGWFHPFLPGTVEYFRTLAQAYPAFYVVMPLVALGLVFSAKRAPWALLTMTWAVVYTLSYQVLRIPYYHWYLAPLLPATVLMAGLGTAALHHQVVRLTAPRFATALSALLVLPLFASDLGRARHLAAGAYQDARIANYAAVGRWLDEHAPPDALVEAMEIGVIGYHAGRTVIDFAGLTRPEIAHHLGNRDVAWSLFRYWPDYVVLLEENDFDRWLLTQDRFRQNYVWVFRAGELGKRPVAVYRLATEERRMEVRGREVAASFGSVAELRTVDVERLVARPGEEIHVMLRWVPGAPVPGKYSSFVHALDDTWKLHAQSDNWLDVMDWPAGTWFRDPHVLRLPPTMPPGRYRLNVGLYQRDPFRNLTTRSREGETTSLTLDVIEVLP